jgi:hypothetical protein
MRRSFTVCALYTCFTRRERHCDLGIWQNIIKAEEVALPRDEDELGSGCIAPPFLTSTLDGDRFTTGKEPLVPNG